MSSRKPRTPDPELVADRLHSAAIHLLRRLRRQDAAGGVGAARLSALSVLVFGGAASLGELAAAEQVTPATMSRVARGLERQGLALRRRDRGDARVVRLRATARGARLLRAARERRVRALSGLLGGMSRRELETMAEAVALLERAFGRPC